MDINGISQVMQANYETSKVSKDTEKKTTNDSLKDKVPVETAAAEYTKSDEASLEQTVKYDAVTIEKMKEEAELKTAQLRSLVEKMMLKQGEKFTTLSDAFDMIKEGTIEVDDVVAVEAQKEVSEDGYWGVNQTSDRLLSFAKALAGNDPRNADSMIEALQRGFDEATKAWGGELPDLCKQTFEATQQKLVEWRDSMNEDAKAEEEVAPADDSSKTNA